MAGGFHSQFNVTGNNEHFPDPFKDVASQAMPDGLRNSLYWCEYIFSHFGTYRMAMERIISYFLTDVEIGGKVDTGGKMNDDVKKKYEDFLNDPIDVISRMQELLRDKMCFHGDVKAITRDGVFKLRDLQGQTVDVLSQGGVYRKAEFKAFGRQELLEVEFSDGRTTLATADHQWVAKNCSGKLVRVPTTSLSEGYRIERTVAQRPARDADYLEGVRHGFVFGDGSCYNNGKQSAAYFFGAKDAGVLKYFEGCGCEPIPDPNREDVVIVNGLPGYYKTLPQNTASASYWYGFVSGFLAADGTVDSYGCAMLTQKAIATLEIIADQLPRIGMVGGPIRGQIRTAEFVRRDGSIDTYTGPMHYVTLLKRFMLPQDFLLAHHCQNFEDNYKPTKYGEFIRVRGVRRTGIVDDVFCCVEMETHTFVIDNGVLTGNCYGNGFASMLVPFKRFLQCPKTGDMYPLKEVYNKPDFKFEWSNFQFVATCPRTGWRGPFNIVDKADDEEKKLKVKRWSPHEIELLHDPYTDDVAYIWRIPADYKKLVRDGNLFHLERASVQVLKAIKHDHVFRFNPGVIYHMKEPTLSGIRNRGWGIPRIITNFRQIYYVQVLRRFNEAIALDYVIPFRLITPAARPGGGAAGGLPVTDPLLMYNGGDFRNQVQQMIRKRRRDPATWQILPFPVQYQMLGGDATQLAPRELLDQGMEILLNDAGTPVELYKGSLQMQTAPVALRLFESTWHHLVHDCNRFLQWLVEQISQIMSWELVQASLTRVTLADDINKQTAALQLMMGQQLSGRTGLKAIGYNWDVEQQQLADEANKQQELQAKMQEQAEQAGFAQQIAKGQPPQPGQGGPGGQSAPGGGGGGGQSAAPTADGAQMMGQSPVSAYLETMGPNVPVSPQDMLATAEQLANELLGLPESIKDSQLRLLKQSNEVLHSLVKAKMEQLRGQAKTQGGAQVMAQQFGQGQQG